MTVLRSDLQSRYGISADLREWESAAAIGGVLGLEWTQWPYLDTGPDWQAVKVAMQALDDRLEPELVFAPAVEEGGHEQHNRVGEISQTVFGGRAVGYMTYLRHGGKSVGAAVDYQPAWVTLKLSALACYRSQIETPAAGCVEHFLRDQHEYVAV